MFCIKKDIIHIDFFLKSYVVTLKSQLVISFKFFLVIHINYTNIQDMRIKKNGHHKKKNLGILTSTDQSYKKCMEITKENLSVDVGM